MSESEDKKKNNISEQDINTPNETASLGDIEKDQAQSKDEKQKQIDSLYVENVEKEKELVFQPVNKITELMLWLFKRQSFFKDGAEVQSEATRELAAVRNLYTLWEQLSKSESFLNEKKTLEEEEDLVDNMMKAIANADDPYCSEYIAAESALRKRLQEYKRKDLQKK